VALRAASQRYGKAAGPEMAQAWQHFSTAFLQFPYGVEIYKIPTQHGPANPLRLHATGYKAGMMLFPYDDYKGWTGAYPPATMQKQFATLAELWGHGLDVMRQAKAKVSPNKKDAAEQDLAIALTCFYHFKSVANQAEFYLLRDGGSAPDAPRASRAQSRMREIISEEMQLAQKQYVIARQHSVVGYEASNHYYYRPLDLVEKVLNCQQLLDELDSRPVV
jgi:hypothetical protein